MYLPNFPAQQIATVLLHFRPYAKVAGKGVKRDDNRLGVSTNYRGGSRSKRIVGIAGSKNLIKSVDDSPSIHMATSSIEFRRLKQLEIEIRSRLGNFSVSETLTRDEIYDYE